MLSVVTFFETTEYTEVESHQISSTNIFLCVLRSYIFWNHSVHSGVITANRVYVNNFLCALRGYFFETLEYKKAV